MANGPAVTGVLSPGTVTDSHATFHEGSRLLLAATTEGLAASPLTQALDWPVTRTRMRARLSLVGYPQMLLRMGYPSTRGGAPSGRRPVADVLRFEPAG